MQHHAVEILEKILEDYCEQGVSLELVFEGTESDWADIKRIAGQYDRDHRLLLCETAAVLHCKGQRLPESGGAYRGRCPCGRRPADY